MRSRRRAVLRFGLGIAFAAIVFAEVVPRIASYGSVAHQLGTVSGLWAAALAGGALLDVVTTAFPWQAVLPQLSFVAALSFTQASTALTTLLPGGAPLGMALSFGFLRRLRVDRGAAAFAVAVTGIWSQVMILVYPLVGSILVFATGQLSGSTAAIAGVSAVEACVKPMAPSQESCDRSARQGSAVVNTSSATPAARAAAHGADTVPSCFAMLP